MSADAGAVNGLRQSSGAILRSVTGMRAQPTVTTVGMLALVLWSVGWFALQVAHGGGSWHFFATGASVLSDLDDGARAGLHVYAEHPFLQIGPFALGAAWSLGRVSDGHGLLAAQVVGAGLGVAVVALARSVAQQVRELQGAPRRGLGVEFLAAAACFTPVWLYAAVASTHLDDVLALALGVAALASVGSGRPVWAGLAVALAVDSKPWALPFAVMLLSFPSMRARTLAVTTAALGVAAGWLPFFVADPETVRALHYTIANRPLSGLRVLDVVSARTPAWDRPLQTVLGAALGSAALVRGRATGVLLVVMAARLAIDPGTNRYYTAGLAVGALLWDLGGSPRRWPWWSLAVLLGLHAATWVPALDPLHGPALVAFAVAATVSVLWPAADTHQRDAGPGSAKALPSPGHSKVLAGPSTAPRASGSSARAGAAVRARRGRRRPW